MRFSKLEIKGFKSFANETVIQFNEQVTGIVGPNGSGKSNIVDAIRWVLGEQKSSELRLEKNSNVIFNGSKSKKGSPYAQVTLVFENSANILPVEYSEVAITRELYRDGDSVYKLNNTVCRLKDITSLLTDTGIGSNTYAIIGFGMVEDLLNNKDNHRRTMIEQAAGITKFKHRKRETLNKLNSTLDDLEQVQNLLTEVESNMKIFQKQARRAERFNKLKSEYKGISTQLYWLQRASTTERSDSLNMQLQQAIRQYDQMEHTISEHEAQLEIAKNHQLFEETKVSDLQKELNKIVEKQKSLETKRDMASQRMSFVNTQSESATAEITKAKEDIDRFTIAIAQLQDNIPPLEQHLQVLTVEKDSLERLRKEHMARISAIDAELAPHIAAYDQGRTDILNLEKSTAQDQGRIAALMTNSDRGQSKINDLNRDIALLRDQILERSKLRDDLAGKLESRQKTLFDQNDLLQQKTQALSNLTKEKAELSLSLNTIIHEIKTLKSLITNLEGYPEAAKFLNTQFQEGARYSVLAEVINTPDDSRHIIEKFLGSNLSAYIVNTYQEAIHYIQLLEGAMKGRSGFFVLEGYGEVLRTRTVEGATPLMEVIECDDIYVPLISHLFHNVYLVESIDKRVINLIREYPDMVCLAKDGTAYGYKGYVSGGAKGLIEGQLIGRQKKLEKLEQEIKGHKENERKLDLDIVKLQQQIEEIKQVIVTSSTTQLEAELKQAERNYYETQLKKDNYQSQLDITQSDAADILQQLSALQSNVGTNQTRLSEATAQVAEVEKVLSAHRGLQFEANQGLKETDTKLHDQNLEILRLEHEIAVIRKDIQYIESQVHQAKQTSNTNEQVMQNAIHEISALTTQIQEAEESIIGTNQGLKAMQDQFSSAEHLYFEQRNSITKKEEELRQLNRNRNEQNILANEIKAKHQGMVFEIQRIDENFTLEFGNLPEEVGLSEESGEKEPLDAEVLKADQSKLKNSILQFGEVNPLALQAYDEIKIRYDEITTQREDILESKAALLATIEEIQLTSTEKYMSTFEQVRLSFKEVFRELFTEDDDCDLLIDDVNNPLDSDITIIAKPKGKRPQSLSQLSGGEKTLTAIAFLFALYLIKPAPFCIFDEIDAPLDDANVEKMNRLIQKFSKTSQFIIITHNKATMAAMDVLYGVYMEMQGISGLSKVDFRSFGHNMVLDVIEN